MSSPSTKGRPPGRVPERYPQARSQGRRHLLGRGIDWYYPAAAAVSGAGSGFVITGGDLVIAVSGGAAAAPGAGVIAGTMALDASVVLSLAARAVGQVALAYGYDPEAPEEKVFALSVINLGTSMSTGAKYAAMADVSRLTQALFRSASWEALNSSVVAQLYKQFATRFGVRVTKQGLGKVVPVIGIALGAGFNWATLEAMVDAPSSRTGDGSSLRSTRTSRRTNRRSAAERQRQ